MAYTPNNAFSSNLRLAFWNTRSILRRKEDLSLFIQNFDIFICVQSWLQYHHRITFPGFNVVRQDRTGSAGGGIVIFIRKCVEFFSLNLNFSHETLESCAIRITNTTPVFSLITFYRIPGTNLPQSIWNQIAASAKLHSNSLLVGDFNAHHQNWNCLNTDCNGNRFMQSIVDYDLFIHNNRSYSRLDIHSNTKSNIDLILSDIIFAEKFSLMYTMRQWALTTFPS